MVIAGIFPFKENSFGRAGNRTRDLMISSQRLWPLDREAGQGLYYNNTETCYTSVETKNDKLMNDDNTVLHRANFDVQAWKEKNNDHETQPKARPSRNFKDQSQAVSHSFTGSSSWMTVQYTTRK